MRKTIIFILVLGLFAGISSSAQAGYSVSIGYNDHRGYRHHPHRYYQPHYQYYPYYYPVVVQRNNTQERVGISDVIVLSKAGVSDDNIIDKIRKTGSVFNLSIEEVEALRKEGVSSRVVNYMLDTNR